MFFFVTETINFSKGKKIWKNSFKEIDTKVNT